MNLSTTQTPFFCPRWYIFAMTRLSFLISMIYCHFVFFAHLLLLTHTDRHVGPLPNSRELYLKMLLLLTPPPSQIPPLFAQVPQTITY